MKSTDIARRSGFWALGARSFPRWLHPGAWWLWALGLALAASRTTNPFLLLGIVGVCFVVVRARGPNAPWARSFRYFVILGVAIVILRVLFQILFGTSYGSVLILDTPALALPPWLAGIRLGGPVYLEGVMAGLYDGMKLATLVICVGAANSLTSPTRLLKSVPAALYEVGVAVVVAISFTPRLVESVVGVRATRRLRGRPAKGPRAIASAAIPILHSALEDSVVLAAAMDARGYGRRAHVSTINRRVASASLLGSLIAFAIGTYGVLAPGTPLMVSATFVAIGVIGACVGISVASRSSLRTVYRPDPWWLPEWWVVITATAVAASFVAVDVTQPTAMNPTTNPLIWPAVPLVPLLALCFAMTPAIITPNPPALVATRDPEMVPA